MGRRIITAVLAAGTLLVPVISSGCGKSSPAPAQPSTKAPADASAKPSGEKEAKLSADEMRARSKKKRAEFFKKKRIKYTDDRLEAWEIALRVAHLRSAERNQFVDVVSVMPSDAGFRVVLAVTGRDAQQWTEIVAKDGDHVFLNPVDLDTDGFRAIRHARYAECLKKAGFSLYLHPRDAKSRAQLRRLGGSGARVAVVCPKGVKDAVCQQAGVNVLPSILHKGTVYPGPRTRGWIAALTGCL